MRLLWSRLSPFVRKVMIVAHERGVAADLILDDTIVTMSEANGEVLALNPLGQIPTLVLDDGSVLQDSRVICEFVDALGDGPALFPADGFRQWDALRRQALGDGILDLMVLWRQERLKPAERQTDAWLHTFALKLTTTLDQLEAARAAFAALPFDIGHAALGAALGYLDFRFADRQWRDGRPGLAAWAAEFEARPAALATHPGEPT